MTYISDRANILSRQRDFINQEYSALVRENQGKGALKNQGKLDELDLKLKYLRGAIDGLNKLGRRAQKCSAGFGQRERGRGQVRANLHSRPRPLPLSRGLDLERPCSTR